MMNRRLMAVMFSDIVGYTAIMQEDEVKATEVRDSCEQVVGSMVREAGGELVQFYGDGILSVFPSAIQAASCAQEIQKRIRQAPPASLRIGIHVGDIVYDGKSVFGDAVNVASRIESLAPAGGICISDKVFDEIKNQEGFSPVSLGLKTLKNVKRQVEVFALSGEGLTDIPAEAPRTFRAVIVDDEELARSVMREYLARHSEIEIVRECANGFEAVKAVTELDPDLLFLDIQMPKLNGFEVLELLDRKPIVIFTTAYDEYALKAFEVHAVDYLLKPFSQERLDEALRNIEGVARQTGQPQVAQLLSAEVTAGGPADRILVRDGANVHVIHVDAIDYVEARDDYAAIRTGGKDILKQVTLTSLEEQLDPRRFIRIHRSFILNIDRLARVELYAKDSRVAILNDGTRLQLSRAGYAKLKDLL